MSIDPDPRSEFTKSLDLETGETNLDLQHSNTAFCFTKQQIVIF